MSKGREALYGPDQLGGTDKVRRMLDFKEGEELYIRSQ